MLSERHSALLINSRFINCNTLLSPRPDHYPIPNLPTLSHSKSTVSHLDAAFVWRWYETLTCLRPYFPSSQCPPSSSYPSSQSASSPLHILRMPPSASATPRVTARATVYKSGPQEWYLTIASPSLPVTTLIYTRMRNVSLPGLESMQDTVATFLIERVGGSRFCVSVSCHEDSDTVSVCKRNTSLCHHADLTKVSILIHQVDL